MQFQAKAQLIRESLSNYFVGKKNVVDLVLTCFLGRGHLLLEDVPGVGKTFIAKTIAKLSGGIFQRIQCTPDLLPSDITGAFIFNPKENEFSFVQGPIFSNVLLVDEINRATPRTQSAFLEAMAEKQVSVEGKTYNLLEPFFVIATQNPLDSYGVFNLPESQLDRFALSQQIGYPLPAEEKEILLRFQNEDIFKEIPAVVTAQDILNIQNEINKVLIKEPIIDYILRLLEKSREIKELKMGLSPRCGLILQKQAKAYAYLQGRDYVIPDDLQVLIKYVIQHRIFSYNSYNNNKEKIVKMLIEEVSVL